MPKYLIEASYTTEGVRGVQIGRRLGPRRGGQRRARERRWQCRELLLRLRRPRCLRDRARLPDNESAAAVAIAVNASGGAVVKTTVLLTPEEVDTAAQKSVGYRAPGS